MQKKSPFKFLDAFGKDDHKFFHGREAEVEALYDMAYESNLILVYGRSGTGKTSLIKCGLANRFNAADWMDIYIRKRKDLNQSLVDALIEHLPEEDEEDEGGLLDEFLDSQSEEAATIEKPAVDQADPVSLLSSLNRSYFKPIYLIFDQFEELFILGTRDERRKFYITIRRILQRCPFCHILLVLREESIAELSEFEKVVPHLFDKRLRVEPLGRAKAITVVEQSCADFNISLNGEAINYQKLADAGRKPNAVAAKIIDEISKGRGRTELTYLQVFLDAIWQDSYKKGDDPINFTQEDIGKRGIKDVLGDFLVEQSARIQSAIETKYPGIPHDTVGILLNAFVSSENTKQPMTLDDLKFPGLTDEQIKSCVKQLEAARILRFDGDKYYELSHDALASKIVAERKDEDIAYFEMLRIVKDTYKSYAVTNDVFLTTNQLALYDEHAKRAKREGKLESDEIEFVERSQREINKKRRRARIYAITAVSVMTIVAAVFVYLLYSSNRESYDKFVAVGKNAMRATEYEQAIAAFEDATEKRRSKAASDGVDSLIRRASIYLNAKPEFDDLLDQGDELSRVSSEYSYLETCDRLVEAYGKYMEADLLETNSTDDLRLEQRIDALIAELTYRQRELETKLSVMRDANSEIALQEASRLQSSIENIKNALANTNE